MSESHLHMSIFYFRGAFRMEAYEVERSSDFSACIVRAAGAVAQKLPEILGRLGSPGSSRRRPSHLRLRQCATHSIDRVVIQLVVFFGSSVPVADVGLIPDFPIPPGDFALAITQD